MLREEVLISWQNIKESYQEYKEFLESEEVISYYPIWGDNPKTRLVSIKDPTNTLKTINLVHLGNLKRLKLKYSLTHEPSLTSITIKNCGVNLYWGDKTDFSCLWQKSNYFKRVKQFTFHYLPESYFPEKVFDLSSYTSLERLEVEAKDYYRLEKLILATPNLKILNWKGGTNIEQILGLEQCKRLEIVKIKDATVNREVGELLKKHPRYQWAIKNLGIDSWEWVVKVEGNNSDGPEIEEID